MPAKKVSVVTPEHSEGGEKEEGGEEEEEEEEGAGSEEGSELDSLVEGWPEWRNKVRHTVLRNAWFERFWLFVIVLNCVTLAVEDPTDADCESTRCHFTSIAGHLFSFLFLIECVSKIMGLGFRSGRGAYLKDEWNVLDFVIVISGITSFVVEMALSGGGSAFLTALRSFRLLRPLKTVQAFPAVRLLVQSILSSLPRLFDVVVLYFFFVLTMGIVSIQLFSGLLRTRCIKVAPNFAEIDVTDADSFLIEPDNRVCTNDSSIFGGAHRCPWEYTCRNIEKNPYWGKLGFDNIGMAGLTLFTGISLEGWSDTMYYTMDARSKVVSLYWVLLIIFGSFFVLNLTIVIITEAFEKKQQEIQMAAFYAIDKDGTGELDRHEVERLLSKKYGYPISEAELDIAFNAMDADGGGTISLDEFLEYTAANNAQFTTKQSSISGLGDDLKSLTKKTPVGACLAALHTKVKNFTANRTDRTPLQEKTYRLVKDPDSVVKEEGEKEGDEGEKQAFVPSEYNKVFRYAVLLMIVLNTISLAVEHHEQPEVMTDVLQISNYVFTVFFTAECILKLYGLGIGEYFEDNFNTFDLIVVIISLIDIIVIRGSANVSVFRTFRVLRVLKLARSFKSLQKWVFIVINSVKGAAILTGLLGLVVFIVALVGMQIFGGKFCFLDEGWDPTLWYVTDEEKLPGKNCGGKPRSNYDSLGHALITTFQILTGEDWNIIMYYGMRSIGDASAVYFVLYYTLGNYLMLNLFIAVLLNNRELKNDDPEERKDLLAIKEEQANEASLAAGLPPLTESHKKEGTKPPGFLAALVARNSSLFCLPQGSTVRYVCYHIAENTIFEWFVLLCILVSTISLANENPLHPEDHPRSRLLGTVDFVMIWVFLAEALVKVVGYGFVLHKESYLRRESWNRLDFLIVCFSLLSLLPGGSHFAAIKIMRVLRPLRFINKSPGMKVVVHALLTSIKPLANVLAISLLVWLIFGIMGVQVFKGTFYRCTSEEFGDVEAAYPNITSKELCLTQCPHVFKEAGCKWKNYSASFDNVVLAMVALFEMASLEGWVTVMRLGTDHTEPYFSPIQDNKPFWVVYFVAFIVFGSFFIINLFIGVLIDTYYKEKEKAAFQGGGLFLNEGQKKWVNKFKVLIDVLRNEKKSEASTPLLGWVLSPRFEMMITVCIILNIVVMAIEHYGSSSAYNFALEIANLCFIGIFTLEAILKIAALSPKNYFKAAWNKFDFTIVVISLIGVVLQFTAGGNSAASVFRILRLARLLRMVKKAKGIKRILKTLTLSLLSLMNVAGVLCLLLFVYATLGVKLFGKVKRGENIGFYSNFESFDNAMLLLLRMSTGEGWQGISADTRVQEPHCDPHLAECGSPIISQIFFVTYTMAGMYVLLNLFIAVILDNFSESADQDEQGISVEYIDLMQAAWSMRSHEHNGEEVLTEHAFLEFLREIGPPLGPQLNATNKKLQYFIVSLDLQQGADSNIRKEEVFLKLFKKNFGEDLPREIEEKLTKQLARSMDLDESAFERNQTNLSHHLASVRVQALIKAWLVRRQVKRMREEISPSERPGAHFTERLVPEQVQQVRVALPSGEEWLSDPLFAYKQRAGSGGPDGGSGPTNSEVSTLLRTYYDNWATLTPEQKAYYNANYAPAFQAELAYREGPTPRQTQSDPGLERFSL